MQTGFIVVIVACGGVLACVAWWWLNLPRRNPLPDEGRPPLAQQTRVGEVFSLAEVEDTFARYSIDYGETAPITLFDCFMADENDYLTLLCAGDTYRPGEGYVFYLYRIPTSAGPQADVLRVLLNPKKEYAYPGNPVPEAEEIFYGTTIGSGPYYWRGMWLVALSPDHGVCPAEKGSGNSWANPVYYFPEGGGRARAWLPDSLEFGVLGFDVEADELYVVPAMHTWKAKRTMKRRRVPKGRLMVMNWEGEVLRSARVSVNYSGMGIPPQSVDVRVASGRVYVLNRVACEDVLPESQDDLPLPDLIAPARIDVFDDELNHLRFVELHHSLWTGRYYSMDVDERAGLILLLESATGQAWLYDLDLELLKHYPDAQNWGFGASMQDFVLRDGLIYVPEVMGQSDTIVTYELGYQVRDGYETGETGG